MIRYLRLTKSKFKYGYTLLELLITFSVIGIMSTLAFVNFNSYTTKESVISDSKIVGLALKNARYYARIKGENIKLKFMVGANTYTITDESDNPITDTQKLGALSGVLSTGNTIKANTCGDVYYDFDGSIVDSLGVPKTTNCYIQISQTSTSTITLDVRTGNVYISNG